METIIREYIFSPSRRLKLLNKKREFYVSPYQFYKVVGHFDLPSFYARERDIYHKGQQLMKTYIAKTRNRGK